MIPFDTIPQWLISTAEEAGSIIMKHYDPAGTDHTRKADGSPVTQADVAAEACITRALTHYAPDIPIVAEEAVSAGRAPLIDPLSPFWLVDPLDGTREFVNGSPDFTVNIGLVYNGEPVMGVVYAPAHGLLYSGIAGGDARCNGNPIPPAPDKAEDGAPLHIVTSRFHDPASLTARWMKGVAVARHDMRGSSLKACLVAAGDYDLYPRFGGCYAWDMGAAHAILRAVGGECIDLQTGRPLTYASDTADWRIGPTLSAPNGILNRPDVKKAVLNRL